MKFTKMQGVGNDYIYVDCTEAGIDNPAKLAVKVSDVRFGIGSDGLILIKPSEKADFFLLLEEVLLNFFASSGIINSISYSFPVISATATFNGR